MASHLLGGLPKMVCALSERYISWGFSPLPPSFSLSGFPLPTSYLTDLLFFILFLFIVTLLYSLSVPPLSVNSPLCFSLSLLASLSLCSLVLFAQTETLSAELKHHSQSWNITLLVVLSSVQSCPDIWGIHHSKGMALRDTKVPSFYIKVTLS